RGLYAFTQALRRVMRPTICSLFEPHYKQNLYTNPKRTAKSSSPMCIIRCFSRRSVQKLFGFSKNNLNLTAGGCVGQLQPSLISPQFEICKKFISEYRERFLSRSEAPKRTPETFSKSAQRFARQRRRAVGLGARGSCFELRQPTIRRNPGQGTCHRERSIIRICSAAIVGAELRRRGR